MQGGGVKSAVGFAKDFAISLEKNTACDFISRCFALLYEKTH